MRRGMRQGMLVAVWAVGWALVAQAGPLEFKHVADNAKWLAHVDGDAVRTSPVTKALWEECLKDWPAVRENLNEFREKWGIKECHGITLYGTKIAPDHGVLIVQADMDKQTLIDQLKKTVKPKTSEFNEHTIYTWTKLADTKYAKPGALAFFKPDTLVVASSVDLVKSALDVLDGKTPNLAGKESPLAAAIPDGAIFLARAVDLENAELNGKHPILKLLRQFDYAEGETEGKWCGRLQVTAGTEDMAHLIKEVQQGRLATFKLYFHDQPGVVALIDKVQLKVDGTMVHMTFEAPIEQVAKEMPVLCEAFREHCEWHLEMCKKMLALKYAEKAKETLKERMKERMEKMRERMEKMMERMESMMDEEGSEHHQR